MNDPHIGEDAELYALSSLTEIERARIDAHVATCQPCLRRLGEAEEAVLALEPQTPSLPLPQRPALRFPARQRGAWWTVPAVAAALIVGFLLPHPPGARPSPQIAMLHSHFNHAQFAGSGPLAKVLYARDRAWYYVIVEGAHAYTVVGVNGSSATALGRTTSHGETSDVFVTNARPFDHIELREGSSLIETAQIR